MTFRPEDIDKIKQAVRLGEDRLTDTIDGSNTTDIIEFSTAMEKISYQAKDPAMTANVTISLDGVNFVAGTNLTAGVIISISTHLIKAVKFVRTAGAGKITVSGR